MVVGYLDPCTLPADSGNCYEGVPRWFYNLHTQRCELFNYTGCLGNPNRFLDEASCQERCMVVKEEPTNIPDTVGIVDGKSWLAYQLPTDSLAPSECVVVEICACWPPGEPPRTAIGTEFC